MSAFPASPNASAQDPREPARPALILTQQQHLALQILIATARQVVAAETADEVEAAIDAIALALLAIDATRKE